MRIGPLLLLLILLASAAATTTTKIAFAQEAVTAEALFERGRKLLAEGKTADACAAFEESQRAGPATGTLLNLGNCFDKLGRTASAWAAFRQAITMARTSNQQDRENYARERVQQLEPKLARLSINVDAAATTLEIHKDGKLVSAAELGAPIPIDPGKHTITAHADGKKDWSTIVEVVAGAQSAVEIPPLEDAPPTPAATSTPINLGPQETSQPPARQSTTLFIVGLGAAGLGAALIGVGTGFGLSANSKADDIETLSRDRGTWSSDYQSKYDDGASAATAATVFFVTGGLALAVGATLAILHWPSSKSSSPAASSASALRTTWAF